MNRKGLLVGMAATLWLLFVMASYAATHKPFDAALLAHAAIALWQGLLVLWIFALGGGLARRLFPLREAPVPVATRAVLQAGIGLGTLGLIILLLGVTLGLRWPLWLTALGLTLYLHREWRGWLADLAEGIASVRLSGLLVRSLAILSTFLLGCTLLTALAPPFAFDTLTYHFTLPRAYLLLDRIAYLPKIMFWGMPQTTEMLYTLAMSLGGYQAATLLEWGIGVLTLLGLWHYVATHYTARAGWVAVATLLAGYSLAGALSSGYVEWSSMLYGLGFLISLELWWRSQDRRFLVLLAALAAFALGSKYTNGILALMGVCFLLVRHRLRTRQWSIDLLIFGTLIVGITLPWWVKNALATGNPFYPLLFPAAEMSRYRLEYYSDLPWGGWLEGLTLPWQATFLGIENKVGPSASIGPLLLGLSPLALFGWQRWSERSRLVLKLAIAMTGMGFAIWGVASRFAYLLIQTRLYVAFFPAWALMGAAGFEHVASLRAYQVRFHRLLGAAVVLSLALNALEMGHEAIARRDLAFLSGQMDSQQYWEHVLGDYPKAMQAIQELPEGASVLLLWDTRGLLCWPKCDPDEVIDRWYDDIHRYQTADRILQAWREQGYTHLLLHRRGMDFVRQEDRRLTEQDWQLLHQVLAALPPPREIGTYSLYSLSAP